MIHYRFVLGTLYIRVSYLCVFAYEEILVLLLYLATVQVNVLHVT